MLSMGNINPDNIKVGSIVATEAIWNAAAYEINGGNEYS